jgi:hypothetical protein
VQEDASPSRTRTRQARRVRCGGGEGAAAASLRPTRARSSCLRAVHARKPRMHCRSTACPDGELGRTLRHLA